MLIIGSRSHTKGPAPVPRRATPAIFAFFPTPSTLSTPLRPRSGHLRRVAATEPLHLPRPSFAPQPLAPDARQRAWEVGLPAYLQHDLDAYKKGLAENSTLLDCLWGELYGSINGAEIDDGAITHEHAQYLRDKFLWGKEDA